MNMDDTIRKAIFHLRTAGEVTWNDFLPGAGDQYTLWYYAERGQYILRDIMTDAHYFIEARSPIEAYKKYKKRMDEAMEAGSYQEEEEW